MRRDDFHYELPPELIAQAPRRERSASRLLRLDVGGAQLIDAQFRDLLEWLSPDDLLVFNDTRVVPARLRGRKATGGVVEVLLERFIGKEEALVQIRASKSPRPGTEICIGEDDTLTVIGREGEFYRVAGDQLAGVFDDWGETPLPPYIDREPTADDASRYQTVYAKNPGAVAAPTAGLHFDEAMLSAIDRLGVRRGFVTLHVGAGTFQPVRVSDIREHRMHRERYEIGRGLAGLWEETRARNGRIVAVGTTTLRCLESAWTDDGLNVGSGDTNIFIYPGVAVRSVDALLTNFHLPESTLIMLVAALAGTEFTLQAYRHAVAERYRFFSYGDAMLVDRSRSE